MVGEPILGSSLTMVEAAVNSEDVDRFDFGTDWWATEVADEFKGRQNWADRHDLILFYAGTWLAAGGRLASGGVRTPTATRMVAPATTLSSPSA